MRTAKLTVPYDGAWRAAAARSAVVPRATEKQDVVGFYTATDSDYGAWSKDFNMHFGFFEPGMNPLAREPMLERMNAKVLERLALPAGAARLADLGCGTGATARSLLRRRPDARVSAVTVVPAQVARGAALNARAGLGGIEFVLKDYTATGLESRAYDGVYAIESACHASGPGKRAVLDEAFRLLKPGKRLVIADCFVKGNGPLPALVDKAYRSWCVSWAVEEMPHVDAVRRALGEAGFTDIEVTDISWNVAPSVAHVPWVASRFVLTELWRTRGRLTKWRRRHVLASVLSIFLGLCRGSFGYYMVSARKPCRTDKLLDTPLEEVRHRYARSL